METIHERDGQTDGHRAYAQCRAVIITLAQLQLQLHELQLLIILQKKLWAVILVFNLSSVTVVQIVRMFQHSGAMR